MAGLALPDRATSTQLSARRSLPNGPCNYRDATSGACGCDQFWDKLSADLHDDSIESPPSHERSTWCVCTHHACFHRRVSRALDRPSPTIAIASPHAANTVHHNPGQPARTQPTIEDPLVPVADPKALHFAGHQSLSLQSTLQSGHIEHVKPCQDSPSQTSTSGLPRVPSVCLLSYDRRPAADRQSRPDLQTSHQTLTGLGLSMMQLNSVGRVDKQQSLSDTIFGGNSAAQAFQPEYTEPELPSTRANSVVAELDRSVDPLQVLDRVAEFNRTLQLDVPGDTVPDTCNVEDFIQSATEVATPSLAGTPDLNATDQAVQEGRQLIDTLARLASNAQQTNVSPVQPASVRSMPGTQRLLRASSAVPQEQLQNILRSSSPQALQKLVSYLAPLQNLLNSIPNVAGTLRDLGSRLDVIENGSFNYVNPEELNHSIGFLDDRLVDLEHRMDEHENLHKALETDQSSASSSRRRNEAVSGSFGSDQSLQITSSAMLLAAMDRNGLETKLTDIKDRLNVLEAASLPSPHSPWEIEIVLLPWGRELRGIWYSPAEPMADASRTTTQESEEWTQARSAQTSRDLRHRETESSPYPAAQITSRNPTLSDHESGWSSQAISEWASSYDDEWLHPKACGTNNIVHKRLQSRGFVRDITLKGASARDLQSALAHTFSDLQEHLNYAALDDEPAIASDPGLRAPFIPLRKVVKESKLRFLSHAEMSSSALWTAQFLAAGILMRVSGGKKRLYVTQREAYMQQGNNQGGSWTWQDLRQLPRYQVDQDSQMEGNEDHCQPKFQDANAEESCWQYIEQYDAPPASAQSSFNSVQISMPPVDGQWRRSMTPSSILKIKTAQPISPLSENHPQRPGFYRTRTASTSVIDQRQPGSSKRRFHTSPVKQSSAPQITSRAPSVPPARLKRRRVTAGSSQHTDQPSAEVTTIPWNPTPRRSREPPSPFYSSQPALPRSNSDIASRPSQRSAALVGRTTPFAYATPHSGPFLPSKGFGTFSNGGDTEPDEDYDDDAEQSWGGVTDGEESDSSMSSNGQSDAADIGAAEGQGSFSGAESGFGSEDGSDEDGEHGEAAGQDGFGAQRLGDEDDEDEEEGDAIFDTLLDVLQQ